MVQTGLYRHFKGDYYYVTGLSISASDERELLVNYFNVCNPQQGGFVRPLDDFVALVEEDGRIIKDRKDNVTGQHMRFERIKDLNFQLGSVSTEQLIKELSVREDSPFQTLDVNRLNDKVFCSDYIVGEAFEGTTEAPRGVFTLTRHDSLELAFKSSFRQCVSRKNPVKVFKRVFIEVDKTE